MEIFGENNLLNPLKTTLYPNIEETIRQKTTRKNDNPKIENKPFSNQQLEDPENIDNPQHSLTCGCPSCLKNTSLSKNQQATSQDIFTASGDNQTDALVSGYSWSNPTTITYSFFTAGSTYYGTDWNGGNNLAELPTQVKSFIRTILETYIEPLINVNFVEVSDSTSSYGQIRYMYDNSISGFGYAYYPFSSPVAGDVFFASDTASYLLGGITEGGFSFILHETGHALGLKHPGNYGSDASPYLPYVEDNVTNTVMSYNYVGSNAATYMPYDLKALQSIYGAKAKNTNNTTYTFSSVYGYTANSETWGSSSSPMKLTIWDSDGIDTLDFSPLSVDASGYRIDLNQDGMITKQSAYNASSYTATGDSSETLYYSSTYGTQIAFNTIIENVINSKSNDYIIANSTANSFSGYSIDGSTGNDTIENANNLDTLDLSAFSSSSVTQTQTGNDLRLNLGTGRSITLKNYYAVVTNQRPQILFSGLPITPVSVAINDVTVVEGNTTTAVFTVTLSATGNNTVSVNYGTSNGTALAGSDYTAVPDTSLSFSPGQTSKTVSVSIRNDNINEPDEAFNINLSNATNATISDGQGIGTITDTLTASVTTILAAGVENLTLTGSGNIDGTGNARVNTLTGNQGNNILNGLGGNDTYRFVANTVLGSDTISETGGIDTIDFRDTNVALNLSLESNTLQTVAGNNLKLTLSAVNVIENLLGGNAADTLTGNSLNNTMVGGKGNDQLTGKTGKDSFVYDSGKAFSSSDFGKDQITDFTPNSDKIVLSKKTFTSLVSNAGTGFTQASEFAKVATDTLASTSSASIVYSQGSGRLYYNPNGSVSGFGTGTDFTLLSGIPNISSTDFVISV